MKKFTYFAAAALLLLGACERHSLNIVSTTSITDASAFNTAPRILNLVRGLYSSARSGNLLGGRYFIYNEIRGENFINNTNNAVTGLTTWNFTVTGTAQEVTGLWGAAYATINQVNTFLDGMRAKGDAVVGATLAPQYHGEAFFIRAICYYDMLQLYARPYWDGNGSKPGVPLRLTGITTPGYNNLARSSVDSVYLQIIADLDSAEAELPAIYTGSTAATDNCIRAHQNAAIALKTRVYLSMGNYAQVITEANKLVPAVAPYAAPSGVPNTLVPNIKTVFSSSPNAESMFVIPFNSTESPGTQNSLGLYFYNGGATPEYYLNANGVIAHTTWTATDARRQFITTVGSVQMLTKWPSPAPYSDWVTVIRYAEVMLNLAEARVRSTGTIDAQAIALLNAVRQRSDPATVFTAAQFSTSDDLANAIVEERNIELLGEGFRSADLMRLGLSFPSKGAAPQVDPTANNYIWPISATELVDNELCAPNP